MTLDVHHAPGLALMVIAIPSLPRLLIWAAVSDPARNRDGVPSQPLESLISRILALAQERDERRRGRDHQRTRIVFDQQRLKAGAQGVICQPLDHVGVVSRRVRRPCALHGSSDHGGGCLRFRLRCAVMCPYRPSAAASPQRHCGRLSFGSPL